MLHCRFPGVSRTKIKRNKDRFKGLSNSFLESNFSRVVVRTWRYFATFLRVAKSENASLQNLSRIFYTHAVRVTLPRKKIRNSNGVTAKKKTIHTHARRTFFFFLFARNTAGTSFFFVFTVFFFFPRGRSLFENSSFVYKNYTYDSFQKIFTFCLHILLKCIRGGDCSETFLPFSPNIATDEI